MSNRTLPTMPSRRRRALLALTGLGGLGSLGGLAGRAGATERLTVMMEELPPYAYPDAEGRPAGYAYEVAAAMLARAGLEADYVFSSWTRVMSRGRSQANVMVPAIVRLPERERQFHWIGQIAVRRSDLYRLRSRPDVNPRSIDEAKAYLTAVIKEDVAERELVKLGLDVAQHMDRSSDYPSMLRKFFGGRTQLIALNQALAPTLLRQYGYDPQQIEPVLRLSTSRSFMAVSLATGEGLREQLQHSFEVLRRDGSLAAIAARYPMVALD